MRNRVPSEFMSFSFRSLKLTAKGIVAYVVAFAVAAVLFALAWRIATSDLTGAVSVLSSSFSQLVQRF
jgi:hypothetical protein